MRVIRTVCCRGRLSIGAARWPVLRQSSNSPLTTPARRWRATAGTALPLRHPADVHARLAEFGARTRCDDCSWCCRRRWRCCSRGWVRALTSRSGRRSRAGWMRPWMIWSASSSTPWYSHRPVRRSRVHRGPGPGPGGQPRRARAPGRALRAAGRGTGAGALAGPAPAVPGDAHPAEQRRGAARARRRWHRRIPGGGRRLEVRPRRDRRRTLPGRRTRRARRGCQVAADVFDAPAAASTRRAVHPCA